MYRVPLSLLLLSLLSCPAPASAQSSSRNNLLPKSGFLPSAGELADKCAKGSGGKEAWASLSTVVLTGTIEMPALHLTGQVELYEKAPNKSLRIITVADRHYVHKHGFDGQMGWELDPRNGLRRLQGSDLEQAARDAIFDTDMHLKEIYPDMKVVGKATVGEREAYVAVVHTSPVSDGAKLYFDAQNGLRIAEESEVKGTNGQTEKTMTLYEDYRTVGGVQMPFRVRFTSSSVNFTIKMENMRANEALDDAVFAMPKDNQAALGSGAARGVTEVPDEGNIEGNIYTNKFFGLEYRFPQGWTAHGEKTKKHIMEVGKSVVSGDSAVEKGAYEAAEKRTLVLLSVFQYPLGTAVDYNNGIQVMSEDLGFAPGIKTGQDYLQLMQRNLQRAKLPMESQGDPVAITFAGKPFFRQDVRLDVNGRAIYEAFVATMVKEHALVFIFAGGTEEARNGMVKTLETVRFDQQLQ